jgi:DNA mismatch repair protein MutS2
MQEIYNLLEFDRLLELCSQEAASELGRHRVQASSPLQDAPTIRAELSLVDEMTQLLARESLPLQGLQDISPTLNNLEPSGAVLDREEFLPLKDVLEISGNIREFFGELEQDYAGLKDLAGHLHEFKDLCSTIDGVFDHSGNIKDSASGELRKIRKQKEAEERKLHTTLERLFKQWKAADLTQDNDSLAFREGRLLIPVRSEHRGRIDGVVQDESATGATVYIEPLEAITVGNAIRRLENEERREIHRILTDLCERLRTRLPDIRVSLDLLGRFDHIYARGRFALKLNCLPPAIVEEPLIRLNGARHPLLALKEGIDVVPLSLTLGDEDGTVLIITGPNAGGKTVALKTVGLLCLMAACGLTVPADEGTTIPVLSSLHCDIGDPQSLEQDLSTFTSHLLRLKEAVEDTNQPKLVLLDEIGAGTDPAEGSAIARAALLEFRKQGALVIGTTHQGTLKVFAHETEGIINGSMEFDQKTLQPTFRFKSGIPGSSYALEISSRVGFPERIVVQARHLLGEQINRMEDLLAKLNESLRVSEEKRRDADLKRIELEGMIKLYSVRLEEFKKFEKEKLHEAAQAAEGILKDANRKIEAAVKKIKEEQASKSAIREAHRTVNSQKAVIDQLLDSSSTRREAEAAGPDSVKKGDWVKLEGLKDPVQVLGLRKNEKEAKLAVGGVHIWLPVVRLTPVAAPDESQDRSSSVTLITSMHEQPHYELDLRGMTGDEAEFALEKYLSDCSVSGWKTVRIIHGKGTGALRTRVRKLLEKYPGVKSFRYGRPEEGDFGVTIVEME